MARRNYRTAIAERITISAFGVHRSAIPLMLAASLALATAAHAGDTAPPKLAPQDLDAVSQLMADGVKVRKIEITGATRFGNELHAIASEHEGKLVRLGDLEAIRLKITKLYVDAGYLNSGATIDLDERVRKGIIAIKVVEGRVSGYEVNGNERLSAEYVSERAKLGAGQPFNVKELGSQLQVMTQDPLIEKIDAELLPGLNKGEALLKLDVKRKQPYELTGSVSNEGSPSLGSLRGQAAGVVRNITGWGDALSVTGRYSEGMFGGAADFAVPVTPYNTAVHAGYERNNLTIIEEPFNTLDIVSIYEKYTVGVSHPLIQTPAEKLVLGIDATYLRSETTLLGIPFSFSPAETDGKSHVAAIRFYQDWKQQLTGGAFAARSTLNFGIPLTYDVPGQADSQFVTWLAQAQYLRQLGHDAGYGPLLLSARRTAQLSDDALLAPEKIAIGGATTVRGYRENTLVRDMGVIASLELRLPVYRLPIGAGEDDKTAGTLELAGFTDYGFGANHGEDKLSTSNSLYSVGAGLRYSPRPGFNAQLYYGQALTHRPEAGSPDLQDYGIHFRIDADLAQAGEWFTK
jgi:hemolysin activation/secretion protein